MVGYVAFILATTTIFLGMDLQIFDLELWVTQIFSFLIIFIALVGMFTEIFKAHLVGKVNLVVFGVFTAVISIVSITIIIKIARN